MPLIAHSKLPSFQKLKDEGEQILSEERADNQSIRELHIGLLNMMPDAALEATERQFFRLVSQSNKISQFYMHPFTLDEIPRGAEVKEHINKYYQTFDEIKKQGLDALIITGANITQPDLKKEPFYDVLSEVINWAYTNVTSTLCSCLATHAVLQARYGQIRNHMGEKCWGVFEHKIVRKHPLVSSMNTVFDVPHSRFNEITLKQFNESGLNVLVSSEEGVHLAVSEDLFRLVFFQGHPEYDTISLLKEYKRELVLFANGDRSEKPPFPKNYFDKFSKAILDEFIEGLQQKTLTIADFPEKLIAKQVDNSWRDSATAIMNNWLGGVYQITHSDRDKPFMDNIDVHDPLNLK